MIARNVCGLKQGLAMGNGCYAAFTPESSDDDVRQLCLTLYGWKNVLIERNPTLTLCRPKETK